MILNDLEDAVKLLSERHVATIYAHNANDFVRVMIGNMNLAIYSRPVEADGSTFTASTLMGVVVFSQPFLLPGTALLIDQFGQIMQVCRYQSEASQNDVDDKGETNNAG